MPGAERPKFTHDCTNCVYLGTLRDLDGRESDMYYCDAHSDLVVRTGEEGPDYMSISTHLYEVMGSEGYLEVIHPLLRVAYVLWNNRFGREGEV